MTASFLDTTVIVNVAEDIEPAKSRAVAAIAKYQPAASPYYALRELLAGRVRILCETHNKLRASPNVAEALVALLSVSPAEGRKREARLQVLANSLKTLFAADPRGSRDSLITEAIDDIALQTARLWSRARKLKSVANVQPLACFNEGPLVIGTSGEIRGPGDSFNCSKDERCAAAAYLNDDPVALTNMITALHPANLSKEAKDKRENSQRRKALKELQTNGPVKFNKSLCRAIGDAYFAGMCPASSTLLSTNTNDFEPLCKALKKVLAKP